MYTRDEKSQGELALGSLSPSLDMPKSQENPRPPSRTPSVSDGRLAESFSTRLPAFQHGVFLSGFLSFSRHPEHFADRLDGREVEIGQKLSSRSSIRFIRSQEEPQCQLP